jgi:hypothetical protein
MGVASAEMEFSAGWHFGAGCVRLSQWMYDPDAEATTPRSELLIPKVGDEVEPGTVIS